MLLSLYLGLSGCGPWMYYIAATAHCPLLVVQWRCNPHSNPSDTYLWICCGFAVGMSQIHDRDKCITAIHKCRIQIQSQAYLFSNLKNIFTNSRLFIQILYLLVYHIFIFVYLYLYYFQISKIYLQIHFI